MTILGCATLSLSCLTAVQANAQEAAAPAQAAAAEVTVDPELQGEIKYIEALMDWGLVDFANDVMEATRKRWPESDAQLFAYEIRRLLMDRNFDEAKKRIDALPDKRGAKYWAARLELANNFYYNDKRKECADIYKAFFDTNKRPSKELAPLMRDACYNWIQLLRSGNKRREAAEMYLMVQTLLDPKGNPDDDNLWCNAACEAAELYLSLAADKPDPKARKPELDAAKKLISKLLWRQDMLIYFGRAIAMKAYYELLNGSVEKAQAVITDYMTNLQYIHNELEKADPDGRNGWLRQSPMPQCRYLMADKYWKEAKEEAKKNKPDEERIKALLFGSKVGGASSKKRDGQGAFNNAVNVYLRFPQSVWAPQAGRLQKEIAAFVLERYGSAPKVNATPEQERNVMEAQFHGAKELFAEREWKKAIDSYYVALGNYPEADLSVTAIENVAMAYLNLADAEKDEKRKEVLQLCAAAIENHLAERFGGVRTIKADKLTMVNAGNAALRLAAREKASGRLERAEDIYDRFVKNYTYHPEAGRQALGLGFEAQKKAIDILKNSAIGPMSPDDPPELKELKEEAFITAEDRPETRQRKEAIRARVKAEVLAESAPHLRQALKWYGIVETNFKEDAKHRMTKVYPMALQYASSCYEQLGDGAKAVKYLQAYTETIDATEAPLKRLQSELSVAVLHQKLGVAALDEAKSLTRAAAELETDTSEEATAQREEALKTAQAKSDVGTKELKICIRQLASLAKTAKELAEDGKSSASTKAKAKALREGALYSLSDCWSRLTYPVEKVPEYRAQQYANLEAYVQEYPKGRFAKTGYFRLGVFYSTEGRFEDSRKALDTLKAEFPDTPEARLAAPMLGKALLNYAASMTGDDDITRAKRQKVLAEAGKTYREMIDSNKGEYSPADYLDAAEVLVGARDWSLAANAYEKAEAVAKQKDAYRPYVAKAHLGKAKLFLQQDDFDSARDALDDFLNDEKLSRMMAVTNACELLVTVAMRQGEKEEDATRRRGHYGAAIGAIKRLRNYWSKNEAIPSWQRDGVELMSSDVSISRMEAEAVFGNDEGSKKAAGDAVKKLETFIKARVVNGVNLAEMRRGDRRNLEKAYADIVRVLGKMGSAQVDEVVRYGTAYLTYFPEGEQLAAVKAAMKIAFENGAKAPDADASVAEKSEDDAGESADETSEAVEDTEEPSADASEEPAAEEPVAETSVEEPAVAEEAAE